MIEVQGLNVRYPGRAAPTLADVDLRVRSGELVLLSGPTGCGKSTLLNCLNGVLFHESQAEITGEVILEGRNAREIPLTEICRLTGSVFQNPDSQICTGTVETEVAFGLENLAVAPEEIDIRIETALTRVGLAAERHQRTAVLSGGQKQRLVIACALAMQPRILLLDEPVSQLDPEGAAEILNVIARLKTEHELGVLIVEHRLEDTVNLAERVVLMAGGRIVSDRPTTEAFHDLSKIRSLGLTVPHLPDLFERAGSDQRPLNPETAPLLQIKSQPETCISPTSEREKDTVCRIEDCAFRYGKTEPWVLQDLSVEIQHGDCVALLGANGSGKSTLLHILAGARQPVHGKISWSFQNESGADDTRHPFGLVVQNPDLMLLQETVFGELEFGPYHLGFSETEREEQVARTLQQMGLADLAEETPFTLSRGQRLRTAVGSVLSMKPRVLLLDEPTTGQDREQIERMMRGLTGIDADGNNHPIFDLVVFCTHDIDTAARHANRVLVLHEGNLLLDGPPGTVLWDEDVLRKASIRLTGVQRYARRLGVKALDVEQLSKLIMPGGAI